MPRKRRPGKARRLPETVAQLGRAELTFWLSHSPTFACDGTRGETVWPTVDAWLAFYGAIRASLYPDRPWLLERSYAERLYAALLNGEALDAVRSRLDAQRVAADPRPMLTGGR